jgi:hypothetical protein
MSANKPTIDSKAEEVVKVKKKRGRKPKPKTSPVVKVKKKRGRKPKVRVLAKQVPPSKNNITEENENIILHIPLSSELLSQSGQESSNLDYKPFVSNPLPFNSAQVQLNSSASNSVMDFFVLNKDKKPRDFQLKDELKTSNGVFGQTSSAFMEEKVHQEAEIGFTKKFTKSRHQHRRNSNVTNCMQDFLDTNTFEDWPQKTDISCWHCCYPFDNMPIGLPIKFINDKFHVIGCFCSFNCALAHNNSLHDTKISERTSLLKFLFRKLYPNKYDGFQPAPDKRILTAFGGPVSIEEYRENLHNPTKEYRILMPPIISKIHQMEEYKMKKSGNLAGAGKSNAKKAFVPLDMKEVERAMENLKKKKKPKSKNSLEVTMGLIQQ